MALNLYQKYVFPYRYVHGCNFTVSFDTIPIVTVLGGEARDDTNSFNIVVPSAGLVLNQTVIGAGGIDQGTIAANTTYALYLLGDPSGYLPTSIMFSQSLTAPLMPSVNGVTYGTKRLIGYISTSSGTSPVKFIPGYMVGKGFRREFYFQQLEGNIQVLNGAAATSVTAVSLAKLLPPIPVGFTNPIAYITCNAIATAGDRILFGSFSTASLLNSFLRIEISETGNYSSMGMLHIPVTPAGGGLTSTIYYQSQVAATMTLNINVLGYGFDV